jgi:hypothetical protein
MIVVREVPMRASRFARQPFMSQHAVGAGPIIGPVILIFAILLMLAALGSP